VGNGQIPNPSILIPAKSLRTLPSHHAKALPTSKYRFYDVSVLVNQCLPAGITIEMPSDHLEGRVPQFTIVP